MKTAHHSLREVIAFVILPSGEYVGFAYHMRQERYGQEHGGQ